MTPRDLQQEEDMERAAWSNHFNLDLCEHGDTFALCDQGCGMSELQGEVSGLRKLVTTLRTMVRERDEARGFLPSTPRRNDTR